MEPTKASERGNVRGTRANRLRPLRRGSLLAADLVVDYRSI